MEVKFALNDSGLIDVKAQNYKMDVRVPAIESRPIIIIKVIHYIY